MNISPLTLEADIANKFPDDNLELPIVNPPIVPSVEVNLPLKSTLDAVMLPSFKWKLEALISRCPEEALIKFVVPCPKNTWPFESNWNGAVLISKLPFWDENLIKLWVPIVLPPSPT